MSFEEFVQGCWLRLFRTAWLLAGGDQAAAEDLLQLALEHACRTGGECAGRGIPSGMCGELWPTRRMTGGGGRSGGPNGRWVLVMLAR